MKRDDELIKRILNYSVQHYQGELLPVLGDESPILKELETDLPTLRYHLQLLSGINFLDVQIGIHDDISEGFFDDATPPETKYWYRRHNVIYIGGLTWEGHDFLDNANNSKVWNAFKTVSEHIAFKSVPKLLEKIAFEFAVRSLKMNLQ